MTCIEPILYPSAKLAIGIFPMLELDAEALYNLGRK